MKICCSRYLQTTVLYLGTRLPAEAVLAPQDGRRTYSTPSIIGGKLLGTARYPTVHGNNRAMSKRYENAAREGKRVFFNSYTGDALA